jgi:3-hydroxyacyl-[acyl-carrier-protein] dehydratase
MRLEYFQMLDEIERLDRDAASLVAVARVPLESPVFEGHFPGHPIMPGVLMLETMAQAAGYLLMALDGFNRMPFFAGVKTAGFRAFVHPGSTLKVSASRIHAGSGYAVVATSLECGTTRVSDAQLTMRTLPFPSDALARHVRSEGERLGLANAEAL